VPPLTPKGIIGIQTRQVVLVNQLATDERRVTFDVHQVVSRTRQRFQASTIPVQHCRHDSVQPQFVEGIPGARLVGRTGNTLRKISDPLVAWRI